MTKWISQIKPYLLLVGFIWLVFFLNTVIYWENFNHFGIRPREITGLIGIITAPFLHGGIAHLVSNTLPMIILPILIHFFHGKRSVRSLMIFTALFSGIGIWLFAQPDTITIGASGVVFGLIGFLVAGAFVKPTLANILATAITLFLYSGVVLSLLFVLPGVSWLAHFFGFVGGIVFAVTQLGKRRRRRTRRR